MDTEILPCAGKMKYLGSIVTFHKPEKAKIQNRVRAAWSAFTHHRNEITSTNFPLHDRLKLFEPIITPSFLWRRYLVHHEQDSKTNTVDTKEDDVMIICSQEHV